MFEVKCNGGQSGILTLEPSVVFSPNFSYTYKATAYAVGDSAECAVKSKDDLFSIDLSKGFGGPYLIALNKTLGTGVKAFLAGELKFAIKGLPGLGIQFGIKDGKPINQIITPANALGFIQYDDISNIVPEYESKVAFSTKLGVKFKFDLLNLEDSEVASLIGSVMKVVGANEFSDLKIGMEVFVGPIVKLALNGMNAKKVLNTSKSSNLEMSVGGVVTVDVEKDVIKVLKAIGFKSAFRPLNFTLNTWKTKKDLIFNFYKVDDNQKGQAKIIGLKSDSLLEYLIPSTRGVLAPDLPISSLFNDKIDNIEYDPKECERTGEIDAMVIGCKSIFCGLSTKRANFCGKLTMQPLYAKGKVNELVDARTIIVNGKDLGSISLSDTLFNDEEKVFHLDRSEEKSITFSETCPSEDGIYHGDTTITFEGIPLKETSPPTYLNRSFPRLKVNPV